MIARRPTYGEYAGGSSGGPSIADFMRRGGAMEADAAMMSGQIWGDTIRGVSQQIGGAIQARAEAKQMAKRDAAWVSFVSSGQWAQDPKVAFAETIRIWGPEEGPRQFQGLTAVAQLTNQKRDPEKDRAALGMVGQAMSKMGPQGRAAVWPQTVALARTAMPELELPDQYDQQVWTEVVEPLLGAMQPQQQPVKVGAGESLVDPRTGETRFSAPAAPAKPPEPRVVGRSLVGPDGKVIYRDPDQPQRDNEPLMSVMGDDGQPVYMPRSQAVGRRPASNREQGRPVTSGDAGRIADLDTSLDDLGELGTVLTGNDATGTSAKLGAMAPNFVTEATGLGMEAKQKQATIDRVKQVIGKALEGGVLRKEDEYKYEKILPTIGDPPEVVQTKLEGLERAITQRRRTTLESLADAGYDTSRYEARPPRDKNKPGAAGGDGPVRVSSPAEAKRLPSGTMFITPDGRTMRVP